MPPARRSGETRPSDPRRGQPPRRQGAPTELQRIAAGPRDRRQHSVRPPLSVRRGHRSRSWFGSDRGRRRASGSRRPRGTESPADRPCDVPTGSPATRPLAGRPGRGLELSPLPGPGQVDEPVQLVLEEMMLRRTSGSGTLPAAVRTSSTSIITSPPFRQRPAPARKAPSPSAWRARRFRSPSAWPGRRCRRAWRYCLQRSSLSSLALDPLRTPA